MTAHPTYTWDHVHIRTPDVEGMATWFAEMLGGEIVRKPAMVVIQLGGGSIFLSGATDDVNPPPAIPYQGLEHIGLAVKDIDAVAASLKAKGVVFTKEPTTLRPGTRVCFLAGPLGISIELLERDAKYT
ncbi:VOC family protein [soil metagenome]